MKKKWKENNGKEKGREEKENHSGVDQQRRVV
jgi:hypothetical protein